MIRVDVQNVIAIYIYLNNSIKVMDFAYFLITVYLQL